MKTCTKFQIVSVCLLQLGGTLSIAGGYALAPAMANSEKKANQISELDQYETTVFGETHNTLSREKRVQDLEHSIFGSTQSGDLSKRLVAIGDSLGNTKQKGSKLLPPMAGQLDHGQYEPSLPPAAGSSVGAYGAGGAAYGTVSEAEKEQLKEAMSLYQQGKVTEAETSFKQLIRNNPKNEDAFYNLGVLEETKGDYAAALSHYKAALALSPNDTELRSAVAGVQNKVGADRGPERASGSAPGAAPSIAPDTVRLKGLVSEAATAYKSGNFEKAISNLRTVAQAEPDDPDVQYALAQAYKAKGQFPQAHSALQQAINYDPSNQLYKDSMRDLNDRIASRGGGATASAGGYAGQYGGSSGAGTTPFAGAGNSAGNNGGPAGQITPFTGVADSRNVDQFNTNSSGFGGGMGQGGGGMIGALAGLLGGSMMGGNMVGGRYGGMGGGGGSFLGGSTIGRSGISSTRLKRAALGGLTGAAVGAVMAGSTHSSVKNGAMKGALMGGMVGLFTGF